jgi:tRNA-2-methylthio-N6-dimethylallyladenosine synthase
LPVQSGSDRILKRMIRRYTRAEYLERIGRLQAARPGLTLSTDIIVGFPGETETDFAMTLDLVREAAFTGLFGFKYSQRPYTPALKLGDDVTEEQKGDRLARLFEVSEAQTRAHLATLVGTTQRVLVEGSSKAPGHVEGRTDRNEIVHVEAPGERVIGQIVEVTIKRANKHSLVGALTAAALASMQEGHPQIPGEAPSEATGERSRKRRALPLAPI